MQKSKPRAVGTKQNLWRSNDSLIAPESPTAYSIINHSGLISANIWSWSSISSSKICLSKLSTF